MTTTHIGRLLAVPAVLVLLTFVGPALATGQLCTDDAKLGAALVPEPATLVFVAAVGAILFRRRIRPRIR
jgi:hypothetical protein